MENSKLIQTLKTFDKKELKALDKFLSSLYAEHELAIALFQYLKSFYPNFKSDKLDLAYITSQVFNLSENKTKRISNEASKLLGWLDEFLILERVKENPDHYEVQKILIDIYKERQLHQFYFRKIESARENIKKNTKELWQIFQLMQLNHAYYYHPFTAKFDPDEQSLDEANHQSAIFSLLMSLKYHCELQSRKLILHFDKKEEDAWIIPEMPTQANEWHQTLYQLYATAYKLIDTKETQYYDALKKKVIESAGLLDTEDHFILMHYLINYTAQLIRKGERSAVRDTFNLYKYGIEKELFSVGGYITEQSFQNLVNLACELKEFDWIEDFVEKNKAFVVVEWNELSIQLANARILFSKKDFSETLRLLRNITTNKKTFNFHTKIIEIQCYYELRDEFYELLEAAIKAFDAQLNRDKTLHSNINQSARNFLIILKLIINGKCNQDVIMDKLAAQTLIVGKYWLEDKIKELPSEKKQLRV